MPDQWSERDAVIYADQALSGGVKTEVHSGVGGELTVVSTILAKYVDPHTLRFMSQEVVRVAAARFVEENYQRLIAGIDADALRNLITIEVAKVVAEKSK